MLLGIDCAVDPRKTGLALAEIDDGVVKVSRLAVGSRLRLPAAIILDWLEGCDEVLIAMDAPLGWPCALGASLASHRAGLSVEATANQLFRRVTDVAIKERLGKLPLEVGANLIARTCVAALGLLQQIREQTGRPIPLAWRPEEAESWRAIEAYPAATRVAHGAPDVGGSLVGLDGLLDCGEVPEALRQSKDAMDAAVCTLAAADFLLDKAVPPADLETAQIEGWIWAAASPAPRRSVLL